MEHVVKLIRVGKVLLFDLSTLLLHLPVSCILKSLVKHVPTLSSLLGCFEVRLLKVAEEVA